MWFRKSSVQLSAAAILALATMNYMTAGIFFTLGVFERMKENEEEERKGYVDKRISKVNNDLQDHEYIIELIVGGFNEAVKLSGNSYHQVRTLNSIKD